MKVGVLVASGTELEAIAAAVTPIGLGLGVATRGLAPPVFLHHGWRLLSSVIGTARNPAG
jgi:hypothetical protein